MLNMKGDILTIIQVIEKTLENLSDKDFEGLIKGEGTLIYKVIPTRKDQNKILQNKSDSVQITFSQELANELLRVEIKEEAYLLLKKDLRKSVLIEIAEVLDIHLRKSDTKDVIREKLVESTVGTRLRSKAIKETDVGRKRRN